VPVDLAPLFTPGQVAVLGASRSPEKLGHRLLKNLLDAGFAGRVIPVNPSGERILGLPSVARVDDLPAGLDLALVSLPAPAVVESVRGLGGRGCRYAVVLASGFGEAGDAGRSAQAELHAITRATGMRIVGPNCMGVVNVPARLNASYFWDVPLVPGGVSFVSQSGAYGGLFFREVRARAFGVAKFLSIGNQADLGFADCLDWLADDPETAMVALFVEGVRDGRAFVEAARRVSRRKPMVALKGGRAEAGRRAAGSHTGSLAGRDETYRAAFRAAGIVTVDDTEEFFDALAALAAAGDRLPRDPGLAILTISGGPSVVAADAAEAVGLRVPPLPEATRARLRTYLPVFGADGNPVDMTPQIDPRAFDPAVSLVLAEPEVAGALAIDVGLDRPEYGDAVARAHALTGKPVVACTVDTPEIDRRLRAARIPIFPTPERAVRAYRALVGAAEARQWTPAPARPPWAGTVDLAARLGATRGLLDPETSRALLAPCGVVFPRQATADSREAALSAAAEIGYPVVVKTARPDIVHKTDVGGVILGVADEAALGRAWDGLQARLGPGAVLVQETVAAGLEWLVGGHRDPVFGPVVAVGLGGILAELVRDVSFRLAPLPDDEARGMIREGRRAALLAGFRGQPPVDGEGLVRVVIGVGELLVQHPQVTGLDLNPLIARGDRLLAVDARILVAAEASAANPTDGGHP